MKNIIGLNSKPLSRFQGLILDSIVRKETPACPTFIPMPIMRLRKGY
jgi:hypothetical protein